MSERDRQTESVCVCERERERVLGGFLGGKGRGGGERWKTVSMDTELLLSTGSNFVI